MNLYLKISYSSILIFFILTDIYADIIPSKIREENINNQIIEYIFDADVIKISSGIENNFNLISNKPSLYFPIALIFLFLTLLLPFRTGIKTLII